MLNDLKEFIYNPPVLLVASMLSFFVSILRIVIDNSETKASRIIIESILCGLLTLSIYYLIISLGWPESLAPAIGGAIGHFGTERVRELSRKVIVSWVKEKKNDE